jgi:hypothetical protein
VRHEQAAAVRLLDRVVRTEPLDADGKSGSQLERGRLDDGTAVVIKHADARRDWIMQATGDDGRIAALWADGVFARLPASVEHGMLHVEPTRSGATVVMRDLSAPLDVGTSRLPVLHDRVLRAAADLHRDYAGARPASACPLDAYYTFLSPRVCERFAADHLVPRLALEGWTRFHDVVTDDIAAAIAAIQADPARLTTPLLARPSTLLHGDLKLANLGLDGTRVVILDWGTLTTWGPPAVDYAWYLAINAAALGADHDRLLADIRRAEPPCDEFALRLALLGALSQLGWEKALGATSDNPDTRERERAGLAWWSAQARQTLESL